MRHSRELNRKVKNKIESLYLTSAEIARKKLSLIVQSGKKISALKFAISHALTVKTDRKKTAN